MSQFNSSKAMKTTQFINSETGSSLVRHLGFTFPVKFRGMGILLITAIITNLLSHSFFNPAIFSGSNADDLYLMDKAAVYVSDKQAFEAKVREVSTRLNIQPEWLMSVMYSESRFDAAAVNLKGSGAVGLIQFMPATAAEINTSPEKLKTMTHTEQLEYVYTYLSMIKAKYGNFDSLTKLYLAILYPKALSGDYCYTLYAKPSIAFKQNAGLDEDKDGRVTVSDVDKRMQRVFPKAYIAGKHKKNIEDESTSGYVNTAGF
ncbi:MAG: transglycosylase SLT domain-containing protein [Bacteroidia bacterium]|nr:transglycosylase SLT domain-containing protein [Bacteroidia bacterium]